MKVIDWITEPIRAMFASLATTDEIALTLRGLGWGPRELDALRMFAQIGGTADDLRLFTEALRKVPRD